MLHRVHFLGISTKRGQWLGTVGINLVNLFTIGINAFFVDRWGRLKLIYISGIMVIIASVGVSVAILMSADGSVYWSYSSIAFLVIYALGFHIALGPMPGLLSMELSPIQYRGFIVSIGCLMAWTGGLVIAQISPILMKSDLKLFGYAGTTILGLLFTLRFVPETKGKTAAEIQRALNDIGKTPEDLADIVWVKE